MLIFVEKMPECALAREADFGAGWGRRGALCCTTCALAALADAVGGHANMTNVFDFMLW